MGLETEIKVELPDYGAYLKIYSAFSMPQKQLTQENIYFDSADRVLLAKGVMFRLRIENGINIFTTKSKATNQNGVQRATENEVVVDLLDLSSETLNRILFELCEIKFPEPISLIKLGSVFNYRLVFENFFGVSLELDHMQILDQHFFEIEIETETPEFHIQKVKDLLQENQIAYKPSSSKYGRFLKLLK